MKKLNKWLLLSIIGLGICSKEVYTNEIILEDRMHTCTQQHMNKIEPLTMANLLANKGKIEALCKALLAILSEQHFTNSMPQLREALKAASITQLKQIIEQLPAKTKAIVIAKIKDDKIKKFLGL